MQAAIGLNASSRHRKRLAPNDYNVGIIVPLAVELTPIRAMLDAIHQDLPPSRVFNSYILGEIGQHNVVIASLPSTGNNDSGAVAIQLLNDFPAVQLGLLVGVGGGVPGNSDIRLGDVVVSEAAGAGGAVIQLDRRKILEGDGNEDEFEWTGHLNKPHPLLASAVKRLRAQHSHEGHNLEDIIADTFWRFPSLRPSYTAPSRVTDQLFKNTYRHGGGVDCSGCDAGYLVVRHPRPDDRLQIHYGPIGSSNSLIRSAFEREKLRQRFNILSVEMEAAGLMDVLPCLVVRGICDYADSHKNKQWQPYAALAAAAYMKELLLSIPVTQANRAPSTSVIGALTTSTSTDVQLNLDDRSVTNARMSTLMESIQFDRMDARLQNITDAHPWTCKWLFTDDTFKSWIDREDVQKNHGFLWVKGKQGTGKSTVMRLLYNWMKMKYRGGVLLSYFFNARAANELEKSSMGLYRSVIHQMLNAIPHLKNVFYNHFKDKCREKLVTTHFGSELKWVVDSWTETELKNFLAESMQHLSNYSLDILIDALDEAEEMDVRRLVDFLEDLALSAIEQGIQLRVCLSSRHYPQIGIRRSLSLVIEDHPGHKADIVSYIQAKLDGDSGVQLDRLRDRIYQKSAQIFLWVVLVIPRLRRAYDHGRNAEMLRYLDSLPPELDELFGDILSRTLDGFEQCYTLLQCVLCAFRPLSLAELYIITELPEYVEDTGGDEMPSKEVLKRYINDVSRGLVEVTSSEPPTLQFVHESVRTFLLKDDKLTVLVDPEALCHQKMVTVLLDYLSQRSHVIEFHIRTHPDRVEKNLANFVLLPYIAASMFEHAEIASRRRLDQTKFLDTILSNKTLVAWVQASALFLAPSEMSLEIHMYAIFGVLTCLIGRGLANLVVEACRSKTMCRKVNEDFSTCLELACFFGNTSIVRAVLDAGPDLGAKPKDYDEGLVRAFYGRSDEVVPMLLEKGANRRAVLDMDADNVALLLDPDADDASLESLKAMLEKYCGDLHWGDTLEGSLGRR